MTFSRYRERAALRQRGQILDDYLEADRAELEADLAAAEAAAEQAAAEPAAAAAAPAEPPPPPRNVLWPGMG